MDFNTLDSSVHRIVPTLHRSLVALSRKSYLENVVGVVLIAAQIARGYSQTPTPFSVVHGTSRTMGVKREGIINEKVHYVRYNGIYVAYPLIHLWRLISLLQEFLHDINPDLYIEVLIPIVPEFVRGDLAGFRAYRDHCRPRYPMSYVLSE